MALVITGGIQFTGGFTWINPPITYFTDPYYNNVVMHLNGETPIPLYISDASPNTTAITTAGNVISSRFSPIWPVGYYSNQFDGSTGYLSMPSNTAFDQTSPFTVECWVYAVSVGSAGSGYFYAQNTSGTLLLAIKSNGQFIVDKCAVGIQITSLSTFSFNTWYHVALSYDGTTSRLFINGSLQGSVAGGGVASANPLMIAYYAGVSNSYFGGYVSNFRITKGTALYTSAFTPPTGPLTTVNGTQTTLLTCMGPNFTDYSPRGNVLTSNGTVKVQPNQPFGALPLNATLPAYQNGYYSNNFAATSYLKTQSLPYFSPTNQAFTMEAWIYLTSFTVGSTGNAGIIAAGTVNTNPNVVGMYFVGSTGVLNWYNGSNLASWTALTLNTWYHIAYSRLGTGTNQTMGFVNGQLVAVFTDSSTYTSPMPFYVGNSVYGAANNTEYFPGYISNARMVVGTAVYTNFFTPSTTPLTAVNGTQTVLLTSLNGTISDSSLWNNTMTNTTATVAIQSPFTVPTTSVTGVTNYGSAQFDGSTGYMSIPNSAALLLGGGVAFTVEAWVYPTASGAYRTIISKRNLNGSNPEWEISLNNTDNNVAFYNGTIYLGTTPVTLNSWNHVAASSNGSTLRIFVNGQTAFTGTVTVTNNTNTVYIGNVNGQYFPGYISNVRVVNGSAVYTTNFVPSNQPLTVTGTTSLLTLQTRQSNNNNVFQDDSPNNFAITRYGTPTQGTFTPFSQNGWSNYFDGSTGYLTFPSNAVFALTANYTIELWYYITVAPTSTYQCIFNTNNGNFFLQYNNANFSIGKVNTGITVTFAYPLTAGQWYHIAVSRSGSTVYGFVNGVLISSGTDATAWAQSGAWLGELYSGSQYISGYVSNFRLINGTALYTSNFTPSTSPLTAVPNTVLLTAQSNRFVDNSTASNTITASGTVVVKPFSPFTNMSAGTVPTGLYSDWFDGSSGYLTMPTTGNLLDWSGSLNYTLEAWVYLISYAGGGAILARRSPTSVTTDWTFYVSSSGVITIFNANGSTTITSTVLVPLNSWNHVAMSIASGTLRLFLNGNPVSTPSAISTSSNNQSTTYSISGNGGGTNFISGYISNLRVVNGTALYTNTFTPSTSVLSAIPGTVLLTAQNSTFTDASTSSLVLTASGGVQAIEVSPFVIPSTQSLTSNTYTTNLVGGSMYFNGSTDNITAAASTALAFGTNNFTIEFWYYAAASATTTRMAGNISPGGSWAANNWVIAPGPSTNYLPALEVYNNSSSAWLLTSNANAPLNAWNHLAITRNSSTFTMYLNGIAVSTATSTVSMDGGVASPFNLGWSGVSADGRFTGYISNARVVNGAALYTGTFAVPTLPPSVVAPITVVSTSTTTIASTSLLLLGTNGGVVDQSGRNALLTYNSATISASTFRTGASSIYIPTTYSYAQTMGTNYWIPTTLSSFTVEAWIYMTQLPSASPYPGMVGDMSPSANTNNWSFGPISTGQLAFYWYSGAGNATSSTSVMSTSTWYHVAASINSGTIGLFVNGVRQVTSGTNTLSNRSATLNYLTVGEYDAGVYQYYGYIDDLRITQGIARYSSTASFIAPTVGLPVQ